MEAKQNQPPSYADVPPKGTNPYHAGYDQTGGQGFVAGNQGAMAMQQPVPGGPVISSNMVVISDQPQPTVIIGQSRGSDLTIPAILVCFFCCWCTGIPAIIYASMAQNDYGSGNWADAERKQRTARGWIIGSVVTHVALWVFFLVLYFTVFAVAAGKADSNYDY